MLQTWQQQQQQQQQQQMVAMQPRQGCVIYLFRGRQQRQRQQQQLLLQASPLPPCRLCCSVWSRAQEQQALQGITWSDLLTLRWNQQHQQQSQVASSISGATWTSAAAPLQLHLQ
jgi:hypothetical protein